MSFVFLDPILITAENWKENDDSKQRSEIENLSGKHSMRKIFQILWPFQKTSTLLKTRGIFSPPISFELHEMTSELINKYLIIWVAIWARSKFTSSKY